MRLALKSALILLAFYIVSMTGFALWLAYSNIRSESAFLEETLTMLGREKAELLDEAVREAETPSDLLAQGRLRLEIENVVGKSDYVSSISVVDADGQVLASDGLQVGTQLARPAAIFPANGRPKPFVRAPEGLFRKQEHMLYLPLWRDDTLRGYMRITFRSARIAQIVAGFQKRLYVEALVGLGFVAIAAAFLQAYLSRRARALTRALDAAVADKPIRSADERDEFAEVFQAANRVRTALTEARQESTEAGRRMVALSDVLRVGLLWFGPQKGLEFANRRALELFGVERMEDVKGRSSAFAEPVATVIDGLQRNREARSGTVDIAVGDDPPRVARVQIYRIDAEGSDSFIGLVTDPGIVEVLAEDAHLANQMQSLARVYRTAVHELRSPLSAIVINMDLLRETLAGLDKADPNAREMQQRYVDVVQQELTRLNQSLFQTLTEMIPFTQKRERLDLRTLVADLSTLIGEQARRQGVDLSTDLSQKPLVVLGHSSRLKQAFLNIVVNALEVMPNGGRLEIAAQPHNDEALVQIRDTGPGLPADLIEKIYDMDYTTKGNGTGTGLFVARQLVEHHGGKIRATSAPGDGTCFEIALPLAS